MGYRVHAIGEAHPEVILQRLLDKFNLPYSSFENAVVNFYNEAMQDTPDIVRKKKFYEKLGDLMEGELVRLSHSKREGREIVRKHLNLVRSVYDKEFEAIDREKYKIVYLEGEMRIKHRRFMHASGRYAEKKGVAVVYLDEGNAENYRPASALSERADMARQKMREAYWVERIQLTIMQPSLLIAGAAHTRNEYGLIEKLREKEITLIPLLDLAYLANNL